MSKHFKRRKDYFETSFEFVQEWMQMEDKGPYETKYLMEAQNVALKLSEACKSKDPETIKESLKQYFNQVKVFEALDKEVFGEYSTPSGCWSDMLINYADKLMKDNQIKFENELGTVDEELTRIVIDTVKGGGKKLYYRENDFYRKKCLRMLVNLGASKDILSTFVTETVNLSPFSREDMWVQYDEDRWEEESYALELPWIDKFFSENPDLKSNKALWLAISPYCYAGYEELNNIPENLRNDKEFLISLSEILAEKVNFDSIKSIPQDLLQNMPELVSKVNLQKNESEINKIREEIEELRKAKEDKQKEMDDIQSQIDDKLAKIAKVEEAIKSVNGRDSTFDMADDK